MQEVLGLDVISDVASRLGVSHEEAAGRMSQSLPQIMEHLSPGGRVQADGGEETISGLLSKLGLK